MKKGIIGKVLPFIIVVLFVGMNFFSTVDSVSLKKSVFADSSKESSIPNNCINKKEEPTNFNVNASTDKIIVISQGEEVEINKYLVKSEKSLYFC